MSRESKKIQKAAMKVAEIAREEGSTSKILRSPRIVGTIFSIVYDGEKSETHVAQGSGITRNSLHNILTRGFDNHRTAAGVFYRYYYFFQSTVRRKINKKLNKRVDSENVETRELIEIQKLQNKDMRHDPKGESGNQVLQITNNYFTPGVLEKAQKIMDLPKPEREIIESEINKKANEN